MPAITNALRTPHGTVRSHRRASGVPAKSAGLRSRRPADLPGLPLPRQPVDLPTATVHARRPDLEPAVDLAVEPAQRLAQPRLLASLRLRATGTLPLASRQVDVGDRLQDADLHGDLEEVFDAHLRTLELSPPGVEERGEGLFGVGLLALVSFDRLRQAPDAGVVEHT